jgi:hypothetical protein
MLKVDDNGQLSDFFRVVAKGIKKYGVKTLITHLQSLNAEDTFRTENVDEIVNYILDCVLQEWKEYSVTKDDLFEANKRGEAAIARKMAIVVIRNNTQVSDIDVAKYFGKVRQVSFRAMREFKAMKKTIPDEARFLVKYERVDAKVKVYISELKLEEDGSSD